jgi:cytochrome c-type biogenesis protein CcmH/NrfG
MREGISSVVMLISAMFIFLMLPPQVHALTAKQVFDQVKGSVVVVKTLDARGRVKGFGSGVVLPSGKIATSCGVLEGGVSYQVGLGKEFRRATLYVKDQDKGLCLLNTERLARKPAHLGKAENLTVRAPVYAVGAPRGRGLTFASGIVTQLQGGPPPLIQTSAAIPDGYLGGGLFDGEGRLVGITKHHIDGGRKLTLAMPVEWIADVEPGRKPVVKSPSQKPVVKGPSQIEWRKRADTLEASKDWQGLFDWCQAWTKSQPESDLAWYSLGAASAQLSRYAESVEAFRQALQINPEKAEYWSSLGLSYGKLNRNNDVVNAYREALRINPKEPEYWSNIGAAYSKVNRHDDAIEAYRQVLRSKPGEAEYWFKLGFAYRAINRHTESIGAFRQALQINPEKAEYWSSLGFAYSKLDLHNDALDAYRQALRIKPKEAEYWSGLGFAYSKLNRHNEAIEAYRQSLR